MTRLTMELRRKIMKSLINDVFRDRIQEQMDKQHQLLDKLYAAKMSKEFLEVAAKHPTWFYQQNQLNVVKMDTATSKPSGLRWNFINSGQLENFIAATRSVGYYNPFIGAGGNKTYALPVEFLHKSFHIFPKDDLYPEAEAVAASASELIKEIAKLKSETHALLSKVTTIKRLLEVCPKLRPFVPEDKPEVRVSKAVSENVVEDLGSRLANTIADTRFNQQQRQFEAEA